MNQGDSLKISPPAVVAHLLLDRVASLPRQLINTLSAEDDWRFGVTKNDGASLGATHHVALAANMWGMTHITCRCPMDSDLLLGQSDGQILRVTKGTSRVLRRYRFSDATVQCLLATTDGRTVAAGHACGLFVVFDATTGQAQDLNTCQLQSEYKNTPAKTTGLLSADDRWLLACTQREEKDVGFLLDLHHQYAPRRLVLPRASHGYTPPMLAHNFVMQLPRHPSLLQCRIQSPELLRQVLVQLVCSESMELAGHYFDRVIDGQLFQKDLLTDQFNDISWRIYMTNLPSVGSWLCTVILTANNDAGEVGHHVMPFTMLSM